jgi:hypothetical protein
MLVMRTWFNNSDPRQTASSISWLAAAIFCLGMSHAAAAAQSPGGQGQAWVTRTAPGAILYSGGAPSALGKGAILRPDDVIDTRGSGRVVIALGDGSQVVIFPGSRVELKNFRQEFRGVTCSGSWWDEFARRLTIMESAPIHIESSAPSHQSPYAELIF